MGELLDKNMIVDLVINIVNILILFFLTKSLLYKPVKKFLDERRERLAAEKRAAEEAKAGADAKAAEYEALLGDADAAKAELMKKAELEAQEAARRILESAQSEAQTVRDKAAAEAAREKDALLADARDEVAGLAVEISARILGRELTDADDLAIAKRFFEGTEGDA